MRWHVLMYCAAHYVRKPVSMQEERACLASASVRLTQNAQHDNRPLFQGGPTYGLSRIPCPEVSSVCMHADKFVDMEDTCRQVYLKNPFSHDIRQEACA
jgi:hypothetical protein